MLSKNRQPYLFLHKKTIGQQTEQIQISYFNRNTVITFLHSRREIMMRCEYCNGSVVGKPNVVVIQGRGPAHKTCHEHSLINLNRRQFAGLELSSLTNDALRELMDMIQMEMNARMPKEDNVVELF